MLKTKAWQVPTPKIILIQEDKIDIESIKKVMTKIKTTLPSFKNQDLTKLR